MQPMRLLRLPQPFDHADFLYELKLDGFRALAYVGDGDCRLVSRNGHPFQQWSTLRATIASELRCDSAVLDGEVACVGDDGRPDFYALLLRRRQPIYCAFDVLAIDGRDLRRVPLLERKRRLRAIMPRKASRLTYVSHVRARGCDFYERACERDLEGVVAKWAHGCYQSGPGTSWLKIKNPSYSQVAGRHELFELRRSRFEGHRPNLPPAALDLRPGATAASSRSQCRSRVTSNITSRRP